MNKSSIILASKSSRREFLLKMIGLKFEIIPSNVSEDLDCNQNPKYLAEILSKKKAKKISEKYKDKIIIGADTVVYLDKVIFGKPCDRNENYKMLKSLSGRTHNVVTGVSIIHKNKGIQKTFSQTTKVTLRKIPNKGLINYIDNNSTLDKAGGYGIQDWFSVWVKRIDGCYYNVMGMPISRFYKYYNLVKKKIE